MVTNPEIIKKTPLVSVLVLTYNRARFIGQAINSVLIQTYKNIELIIIDDGSTDNTKEIVNSFNDSRIKYIQHSKNRGLMVRRRESITFPIGKYIAILDSDDIWISPDKLTEQIKFLENNPHCGVVGTFITILDENNKEIGNDKYYITDKKIRSKILARNQFTHSSVVMRTSLIKKIAGYRDTDLAEDFDLFLQLGMVGTFANLPKYMTAYRIHPKSFNHQRLRMAKSVQRIIRHYKGSYPSYWCSLIKGYIRILYCLLFG